MIYQVLLIFVGFSGIETKRDIHCPSDMYLAKINDGSLDCLYCSDCLKGTGEIVPCLRDSDRICAKCPKDTFNDGTHNFCRPCTSCRHGQCIRRHCKNTHDAMCETGQWHPKMRKPQTCPKEMKKETFTGIHDKIVDGLKQLKEKILSPNCPTDMYLGVLDDDSYDCLHCSDCRKGTGEIVPCYPDADRVCVECPKGTFNDGTQNYCRPCKHCGPGQYFIRHCTKGHDVTCGNGQRNPNITKAQTGHGKIEAEKPNIIRDARDKPFYDTNLMIESGAEDITMSAIVTQLGVLLMFFF